MGEEICCWIPLVPGETCDESGSQLRPGRMPLQDPCYIRFVEHPVTVSGRFRSSSSVNVSGS